MFFISQPFTIKGAVTDPVSKCMWRKIYVLGPPVSELAAVQSVVHFCLSWFVRYDLQNFQVTQSDGPLIYKVPWVKSGETKRIKHGMKMPQRSHRFA